MNPKNISTKEVLHIAKLVSLPMSDQEAEKLAPQLSEAVTYVEVLQELDLAHTSPTSQVTGLVNVFRDDVVQPSLTQEQALSNGKDTHKGYFVVPAVIEKEG